MMDAIGRNWTRRDFLAGSAAALLAGVVAPVEKVAAAGRSKVVLVRDAAALDVNGKVDGAAVRRMLDQGVAALAGKPDAASAWKSWFGPQDTVGIKSNVWRFLPTPPEVEEAIRRGLLTAGVEPSRIAVDDRGVLRNPVFKAATAFVNVRPMRTHHWAGVGSLLKNYIMFVDEPSAWHSDSCADLGGIWKLPHVVGRTRLNVLVMLTPLFHSVGPHDFNPKYTWPYRGLLVGTDPVAVDATGLRILEAQRRRHFKVDEPLAVPPKHIRVAAEKYGLGVADPAGIEVVQLGWGKDVLI